MIIRYTTHAQESIQETNLLGFCVTQVLIQKVLESPERVDTASRHPQIIAQRPIDEFHVLRVVYRCEFNYILVITTYVGRRKQYER